MTDALLAFLAAVHAEDERVARAATPGPWVDEDGKGPYLREHHVYGRGITPAHLTQVCSTELGATPRPDTRHIARHDPQSVLARVEAERAVVRLYSAALNDERHPAIPAPHPAAWTYELDEAVRLLAYGYRHRDGWAPEFAPYGVSADA